MADNEKSSIGFLGSRLVLPYQNGQKHGVLYTKPSDLGAIVEEGSAVGVIVGGELRWLKGGVVAGDLVAAVDEETGSALGKSDSDLQQLLDAANKSFEEERAAFAKEIADLKKQLDAANKKLAKAE